MGDMVKRAIADSNPSAMTAWLNHNYEEVRRAFLTKNPNVKSLPLKTLEERLLVEPVDDLKLRIYDVREEVASAMARKSTDEIHNKVAKRTKSGVIVGALGLDAIIEGLQTVQRNGEALWRIAFNSLSSIPAVTHIWTPLGIAVMGIGAGTILGRSAKKRLDESAEEAEKQRKRDAELRGALFYSRGQQAAQTAGAATPTKQQPQEATQEAEDFSEDDAPVNRVSQLPPPAPTVQ